jgi:UTP-glucose-1-phosphate uridylyltransferase
VALEFDGDYYDTGTVPGYLRANLTMAMRREGLREELGPLLRDLLNEWLAADAAGESSKTRL